MTRRRPRTRSCVLVLLLIATALAGCIGGEDTTAEIDGEQIPADPVCNRGVQEGQITPGSPLSAQASIDREPAEAQITYAPDPGAGPVDLTLERHGSEVWRETPMIMGGSNQYQVPDLDAGNYTLTASTEAGFAQAQIELLLRWGDGECA